MMLCTANYTIFFNTERMDAYFRCALFHLWIPYELAVPALVSSETKAMFWFLNGSIAFNDKFEFDVENKKV